MIVVDGNNSCKRMAQVGTHTAINTTSFEDSDYFLSNSFVDSFANEVHRTPQRDQLERTTIDVPDIDGDNAEGDPADTESDNSKCGKNWKAAAADELKRMWGIWAETGNMVSCCRHGFILWIVDMIRSGELCIFFFLFSCKC